MDERQLNISEIVINSLIFGFTGFCTSFLSAMLLEWINIKTWTAWFLVLYIALAVIFSQIFLLIWALVFGRFSYFLNRQKEFLTILINKVNRS